MAAPPKPPIVVAALLLVAALIYFAIGTAELGRGTPDGVPPAESGWIRVVSWNLLPGDRADPPLTSARVSALAEVLRGLRAQAICLQHVPHPEVTEDIRRSLGDGWTVAVADSGTDGATSSAILLASDVRPLRRELIAGRQDRNALVYSARESGGREFVLLSVSLVADQCGDQLEDVEKWLRADAHRAVIVAVGRPDRSTGEIGAAVASVDAAVDVFRRGLARAFVSATGEAHRTSTLARVDELFVSTAVASNARVRRPAGLSGDEFSRQPLVVDFVP